MQHYPMSAVGFAIDEEVAKQLGLSHEYEVWDSEWDYDSFCMEFDYLYAVERCRVLVVLSMIALMLFLMRVA